MLRKWSLVGLVALAAGGLAPAYAQSSPDLSGIWWALDDDNSKTSCSIETDSMSHIVEINNGVTDVHILTKGSLATEVAFGSDLMATKFFRDQQSCEKFYRDQLAKMVEQSNTVHVEEQQ